MKLSSPKINICQSYAYCIRACPICYLCTTQIYIQNDFWLLNITVIVPLDIYKIRIDYTYGVYEYLLSVILPSARERKRIQIGLSFMALLFVVLQLPRLKLTSYFLVSRRQKGRKLRMRLSQSASHKCVVSPCCCSAAALDPVSHTNFGI